MDSKSKAAMCAIAAVAIVAAVLVAMELDDGRSDGNDDLTGTWYNAYTEGYYADGDYYLGETVNSFPLTVSLCSDTQFYGSYHGEPVIGTINGDFMTFVIYEDEERSEKIFTGDLSRVGDGLLYMTVLTNTADGFEVWYDSYVKEGSAVDGSARTAVPVTAGQWDLQKYQVYDQNGNLYNPAVDGYSLTFTEVRNNVAKVTLVDSLGTFEGQAVLYQDGTAMAGMVGIIYQDHLIAWDLVLRDGVLSLTIAAYSYEPKLIAQIQVRTYTAGAEVPAAPATELAGTSWTGTMTTLDQSGNVTVRFTDYRLTFESGKDGFYTGAVVAAKEPRFAAQVFETDGQLGLIVLVIKEDSLSSYVGSFSADMTQLTLTGLRYDAAGIVTAVNTLELTLEPAAES